MHPSACAWMLKTRFHYKKQPLILGAAVKRCSGSKLSGLQLYFTGVFEDFGHIFPTFSKKFTKILKEGKIFPCVTLFSYYFFVSDKICYHETYSGTHITNRPGENRVGMSKLFCLLRVGPNKDWTQYTAFSLIDF